MGIDRYHSTSLDVAFVIFTWYIVNGIEWVLHMLSHSRIKLPFFRNLHDIHMKHHKVHYPVKHLLKPGPYEDGGGIMVYGPLVLLLAITAFVILPFRYAVIFDVEALTVLSVSTYLHDSFHIEDHWLERYDWFLKQRALHFYHHGHLKKNMSLSGIDTTMDKCMRTFVPVIVPARHSKQACTVPQKML